MFDRNAKSPERARRAFQQIAKFGQADGVSIGYSSDLYTVLLASGNTGLDKSAGLKLVNDPAGGLTAGASGEKIVLAGTTPGLALSASGLSFLVEPNGGLVAFSNGVGVLVDGTSVTLDGTGHLQTVTHGTVTSVGLSAPGMFTVSGSPVTASGTLTFTLNTQTANQVFAGPTTGSPAAPTFRALVAADVPALAYVSSVGLSAPGIFTVTGSPVTATGTLALSLANQNANLVWAGPSTGVPAAPTFRALVPADYPVFIASGASHAVGAVPDPGNTAGTKKFLCENATWVNPSPLTTKGDLWGFAAVDARLPVGADRQTLVADSSQANGVKWTGNAQSFAADPTVPALVDGEDWYQSTAKAIRFRNAGLTVGNTCTAYILAADSTAVANTLTQTTTMSGVIFPANFFTVGKSWRIKFTGTYNTGTTAGNLSVGTYMHPATGSDVSVDGNVANAYATSATGAHYFVDLTVTCRSVGVSGTFEVMGWILFGAAAYTFSAFTPGPVTVDTTQTQQILVKITWSATNASNTSKLNACTIEVLDQPT